MKYTCFAVVAAAALLSACAVVPAGPSVMALPGTGKSFDQFRADDYSCRQFALQQVGGVSASEAANTSAVGSAAVGTALGAAAGAAFGGGRGAAIGAGAGLLAGSAVGMNSAQGSSYDVQRRYDYAYMQCMYASGNRIPVPGGGMSTSQPMQQRYLPPPPPGSAPPPPPQGY
ncbi:YMGG-like glycine zipper-containing protein [Paraburkholderia caballeronis]|uniref:YMGG-like Gly-zipper n=1 Tax=Paraburkholderia caballeronis TaxID=416943 RepID=A0A1H7QHT0_9BURK|nr:YMGG-like glycine zipper-containing protein [Paraburkholderia caballeronis]PXW22563.1 YmgG-like glycine-zipper protein [Paraburkholderia caballeronis]PXW96434.1 YmgG-like glycine-zipper protein [Paraburkholderia caballeronis]RAJ92845.1 YmgG-like glycine-zipper protein [Paraburkholderia caballeronis]SEE06676.1 YMGG-like Gly-zipper [Paraburkholderia caballeronis]SEL47204.1 YMGG-like Gly-zipper [Paraburkholderia caballeronis]